MAVVDRVALSTLGVGTGDFLAIGAELLAAADADPLDTLGEA